MLPKKLSMERTTIIDNREAATEPPPPPTTTDSIIKLELELYK